MYRTTHQPQLKVDKCPKCGSKTFLFRSNSLVCQNCGYSIVSQKKNKYRASKTVASDGTKCDSKFEATISDELRVRKIGGDIKDYIPHYKIDLEAYGKHICNYYVDFLITHNDGHLEYYEVKSSITQTPTWKLKWKMLEAKLDQEDKSAEMTVRMQRQTKPFRKIHKK